MQTELSKVDSEPYHCNFNIRELLFFTNTNIFVLLLHKDLTVLHCWAKAFFNNNERLKYEIP